MVASTAQHDFHILEAMPGRSTPLETDTCTCSLECGTWRVASPEWHFNPRLFFDIGLEGGHANTCAGLTLPASSSRLLIGKY